jgi:hypothetical protein
MTDPDGIRPQPPVRSRADSVVDLYIIALSVVMMLFGLKHWAVIIGIIPGPAGPFQSLPAPSMIATMHMGVVDLVASVGLWMRASWGKVIWIYAALSEIVIHTVFIHVFGANYLVIGFHAVTLLVFIGLTIWARRSVSR